MRNILIGIIVIVLAAGGWWYLTQSQLPVESGSMRVPTPVEPAPAVTPPQQTLAVQKISWSITMANPTITDKNDYHMYENAIAVNVTFSDGSTKQYNVGKAMGCAGTTNESVEGDKKVFGQVNCYYALTGTSFVAFSQGGKFIVERGDESAKDGSVRKTVVLEI